MMESEVRDEVCDFDNLYRAMQHCKNNVMWKDSVAGYVKNGLVRRARRNCHNLIICMDQYYKNLWRESKCLDLSVQENSL